MFQRIIGLCLLSLCFTVGQVNASHIVGGEIYWECAGNGQYVFTLVVYHDCNGAAIPTNAQQLTGPSGNIACNYMPGLSSTLNGNCSNANCAVSKAIYQSAPVSLSGIPPATGWEFSWSSCCKYSYENAPGTNGIYLRAKMYPYQVPGSTGPLNASACYDNSPVFGQDREMVVSDGLFEFNHQAMDFDQDSIVVEFADVLTASNTPAAFSAGYSSNAPFPDQTENPLNSPNQLDPINGLISLETYGATNGFYQNALVIKSYRNKQLIAEVFRELPVRFVSPWAFGQNNPPTFAIDTVAYPFIQQQGSTYRIAARNNDTIDFTILVQDLDMNSTTGLFQPFCVSANGTKINSSNPGSLSACPLGGPCATLNPYSASYCGSLNEYYNFNWLAQCNLLSAGLQGRTTYAFYIEATDQACPYPKTGGITILVDLYPSAYQGPLLSVAGGNVNGDLDLQWTASQSQASSPFDNYILYGNSGPGTPFFAIDSLSNRNTTQLSLSGQAFPAEYFITEVSGSCGTPSAPSDTISSSVLLSMANSNFFPFEVYPQPTASILNIKASALAGELEKATIYDLSGSKLQEYDLSQHDSQWTIAISQAKGVYMLVLEGDGQSYRKRIVLN